MIPVLDRLTTLVDHYREDPGVLRALPAKSPLDGRPERFILWGLIELSRKLHQRDKPGRAVELGLAVILRIAALTGRTPEEEPSRADLARLSGLQAERLSGYRGPNSWKGRPVVFHIERAFSQLVQLTEEPGGEAGGRLALERLRTLADLANYVLFALAAAGLLDGTASSPRAASGAGGGE